MTTTVSIRKTILALVTTFALTWIFGFANLAAQDQFVDRSNEIKAAYIYNFGKYVVWPPKAANGNFVIGIVGTSPLSDTLEKIAKQKTISGRKINVRLVAKVEQAADCELLFFPNGQLNPLYLPISRALKGAPNLLVGEQNGFAMTGGMINFYKENNKVKFEINTNQASLSGLKISSKLLRLGRPVGVQAAQK